MEQVTNEKREQNFELFKRKLQSVGVNTSRLEELYKDLLTNATYCFSNKDFNFCGDGQFLNTVLRILTPTALKLNEILPDEKKIPTDTLIKTCLLHQISKAIMVTANDNKWEIENKGMLYKFNPTKCALKCGMRSVAMCIECGIELTEQELEAISNLDREEDKQMKFFSSNLSVVLRQANELVEIINKK